MLDARQVGFARSSFLNGIFQSKNCNFHAQTSRAKQPKTNATVARASIHEKPVTVGIAGAGIGGLATAIALLATPETGVRRVVLFEPRSSIDIGLGGALNLNSGAAVLAKRYELAPDLWKIGRPLRKVQSRVANGTREGGPLLMDVDVESAVRTSHKARQLLTHENRLLTMSVMRDQLQRLLVASLPPGAEIQRDRKVSRVFRDKSKYRFELSDGSVPDEQFDLVIGADGIRSTVRKYICEELSTAEYSGVRVQFAVAPASSKKMDIDEGTVYQWFGDGAYALQYAAKADNDDEQHLLAVAFRSKSSVDENVGYEPANIRRDCEQRLEKAGIVQNPVMDIFSRCDRFVDVGVYNHKPLKTWTDEHGGCTLVGDAAHAMSPFLGAGANAAIQDAHALATALSDIGRESPSLGDALMKYENSRLARTAAIMRSSKLIGLMETQGGALGVAARNNLLRFISQTGIASRTYLESALPTVL